MLAQTDWDNREFRRDTNNGLLDALYAVVPEQRAPRAHEAPISLMTIYKDRRFQRLAPLSALLIGTAWSMQGEQGR
jgi:hypothetical protein